MTRHIGILIALAILLLALAGGPALAASTPPTRSAPQAAAVTFPDPTIDQQMTDLVAEYQAAILESGWANRTLFDLQQDGATVTPEALRAAIARYTAAQSRLVKAIRAIDEHFGGVRLLYRLTVN